MQTNAKLKEMLKEIADVIGDENVLTDMHQRAIRAATAAPFPLHKWEEHVPDAVVLPRTTEEVAKIVKLANKYLIPLVPRAGGSGLCDGAVPLKKGIVVDIKRMNDILEIDEENMCATVQTGVQPVELNRVLRPLNLFWPDDPVSYYCVTIGGRIGTGGWSDLAGYGHVPELVRSMRVVLPTGEVITASHGGGRKLAKSSVGFRTRGLFIGNQGTLGIVTEATLEIYPRPEAQWPCIFGFPSFETALRNADRMGKTGLKSLASMTIFDELKVETLRRDDPAYIIQPESVRSVNYFACFGAEAELKAAQGIFFKMCQEDGGVYFGKEISEGDWACRHERYHNTFHSRTSKGMVKPGKWHCEDSALPYSAVRDVFAKWHQIAKKYTDRYGDVFDDYGGITYPNNPFRPWGSYICEIDIMIDESKFNEKIWQEWLNLKREIAEVALDAGGSISACHGGTRPGDVDLACHRELAEGQFELMKKIKKMLDPNNIMNPGKYCLDEAYQ